MRPPAPPAADGGIGIGFYQPVRNLITGDAAHPPLYKKVLAAATTGAIGNAIATPCDVVRGAAAAALAAQPAAAACRRSLRPQVKVRLQADGRLGRQRYSGTFDAFRRIPAEEGLRGLYKGVTPTVARAAFINGAGIASYDHSKHLLLVHSSLGDSTPTHALASGVSGLMSAVVSVPFDVVKTRIMNQHRDRPVYSGVVDCFAQTLRNEGPRALYKGFLPAYLRLAPWQLTFFLAYEQISRVFLGSSFQTTNARA